MRPSLGARAIGLLLLVHPFPSVLDAGATVMLGLIAGGEVPTVVRLGVAMLCFQASIGASNDWADVERDRGRKPHKPIPGGLVSSRTAAGVAVVAGAAGIGLTIPSGPAVVGIGLVGLFIGLGHNARLVTGSLSWLPWALGIPLLPVFAWTGAAGRLPGSFAVLVPMASIGGAALALANSLADMERDLAAGAPTIATMHGRDATWRVGALLLVAVGVAAIVTADYAGGPPIAIAGLVGAAGVVGFGLALGRRDEAALREIAWETEALGVGLLAAAWLLAVGPDRSFV